MSKQYDRMKQVRIKPQVYKKLESYRLRKEPAPTLPVLVNYIIELHLRKNKP